jgi:hypothetical protein
MADNHPQIDILSTPSLVCINPVYNCLQYCFQSNDYQQQNGVLAEFQIDFTNPTNEADGILISVAGSAFQTGTPTTFEKFQMTGGPPLTLVQIVDNFVQMLQANFDFFTNWIITRTSGVGIESVFGVARTEKAFTPYTFTFPFTFPPAVNATNGSAPVYLDNYRLIVEIWDCSDADTLTTRLSQNAYEFNPEDSQVCIDLSRNLSSLVSTTFPGLVLADDSPIKDTNICRTICLRYGQIFDEGLTDCDATPQYFETSSPIVIINSAFQKPEEVDSINSGNPLMAAFCYTGEPTRFLTDYPAGLKVCPDSCFWLWYNLDADLSGFTNPTVAAFYRFFYTDNTISSSIRSSRDLSTLGCWAVPAGECQVGYLADPLKTIEAIETTIIITDDAPSSTIISEQFLLEIDLTACCCREFYFLNEKGGFDIIRFNCETNIDLNISSAEVCGFENCEGDILKGGKAEADRRAFETFTAFGRWNEEYFDLDWFRQFLKSPIRYLREDGKLYKIKLLTDEIALFRFEEKIFIELDYILSFELNQQNA